MPTLSVDRKIDGSTVKVRISNAYLNFKVCRKFNEKSCTGLTHKWTLPATGSELEHWCPIYRILVANTGTEPRDIRYWTAENNYSIIIILSVVVVSFLRLKTSSWCIITNGRQGLSPTFIGLRLQKGCRYCCITAVGAFGWVMVWHLWVKFRTLRVLTLY